MKPDNASATGATAAFIAASIPVLFSFTMPHSNASGHEIVTMDNIPGIFSLMTRNPAGFRKWLSASSRCSPPKEARQF